MSVLQILALSEGAGGLFDFNATLPLIATQFILLSIILTFVFYKPVAAVLKEREMRILVNLDVATLNFQKADKFYLEYEEQLKAARLNAQSLIYQAEKEAKEIVTSEITQARNDAAKLIEETNKEFAKQKSLALEKLETQVDELTLLIKEKILS
jgi:F-type H+-transporting ATPase subunit b